MTLSDELGCIHFEVGQHKDMHARWSELSQANACAGCALVVNAYV